MQDARDAQGVRDAQGAPVERGVLDAPDVRDAQMGAKPMA